LNSVSLVSDQNILYHLGMKYTQIKLLSRKKTAFSGVGVNALMVEVVAVSPCGCLVDMAVFQFILSLSLWISDPSRLLAKKFPAR